jgi:heterodisulfide reductase subunit A-like polyferredoxin
LAKIESVVVIGGGIAGMQASLDLADRGYQVHLVEKAPSIGGKMALLDKTFPTMDCAICILAPKMIEVFRHPNIKLLSYSEMVDVSGSPGDLTVKVLRKRRYVDEEKCTGCNNCADVCTVSIPNEYNEGLNDRKAVYRSFPQAIPNVFTIDKRGLAPCRAACPGGVNVQGYVALITDGKYEEALELVREAIPFPTVCGKVCFHPCESECERSKVDEPIAIKALKRFVSDYELQNEHQKPEPIPKQYDEKVAIVGSGPAGLTAAYELVKRGYHATVFESLPEPGGMLRYAIPSYRLPKEDLNREIQWMEDQGVEIVTNRTVGKDLTLKELYDGGYKAVFMAIGAQKSRLLMVDGEDLDNIHHALHYLQEVNMGKQSLVKGRVAVIGGGNVAIDAVRSALRDGAPEVHLLYRRSKEEMPAYEEDVVRAEEEGVHFHFLVTPTRFIGDGGKVSGAECIRMELGPPDESGRRRPVPIDDSEFTMEFDTIILAIGQTPNTEYIPGDVETTKWDTIAVNETTLETSLPSVFAGGDIVDGPSTVIDAIAAGKRGAESIHRYLRSDDLSEGRDPPVVKVKDISKEGFDPQPRAAMPVLKVDQRTGNYGEVDLGFTEEMAKAEAGRCLACGGCSECMECVKVCDPDAIIHDQIDEHVELNVGAVIVATGFNVFDPSGIKELGYGRYEDVITAMDLERLVTATGPTEGELLRPSNNEHPHKIAFLQCVGSRSLVEGQPYCSAVCCMHATKEAVIVKDHDPDVDITIFYTDIRAYGKGFREFVNRARDEYGIKYVRAKPSEIRKDPSTGELKFWYEETLTGEMKQGAFDLVVLCTSLIPSEGNVELAKRLGIEVDELGFFEKPERILAPFDTTREGILVCGYCQGPKDIPDSIAEASGAAARAAEIVETHGGHE